jgi:hypothetical protein
VTLIDISWKNNSGYGQASGFVLKKIYPLDRLVMAYDQAVA